MTESKKKLVDAEKAENVLGEMIAAGALVKEENGAFTLI